MSYFIFDEITENTVDVEPEAEPSGEDSVVSEESATKRVIINEEVTVSETKNNTNHHEKDDDGESSVNSEESEEIYVDQAIFNEWGCHYSCKQPWNDIAKPTVKIFDYSKLKLNEAENDGILSDRIVASCSSYLDKSPYVNKLVMCKCVLASKRLRNIDILTYYHYLQYLDLSNNELTDLKPLGQLPFLMYLDVSKNLLTTILDFKAPFYLTYVNCSYNLITEMRDLSDFWSIMYLDLTHNSIKRISGLESLKYLRHLSLADNNIECIENLSNANLQVLQMQHNNISKFEMGEKGGLQCLKRLVSIDLSYNRLSSLKVFRGVSSLQDVDMTANRVCCLIELNYLRTLPHLSRLSMKENPVSNLSNYYRVCVDCVRNISFLDGYYIAATEKVKIKLQFCQQSDFRSNVRHGRLLSIEHLQSPFIGYNVVPVDQPPPAVIVLVGTVGSQKGELVREFCKQNPKYTVIGVSHTTRPKNKGEVDHESYHFVTLDEFRDILKQGKFLSIYEILGNCYGFAESELEKVKGTGKVLVTHLSLEGGLLLRARGLNPTLVLTMPCDPDNHHDFLRYKYHHIPWDSNLINVRRVINCPERAEICRELEEKLERLFTMNICKNIVDEIVNDLPQEPGDTDDTTWSMEAIQRGSSSSDAKGSSVSSRKGYSVTFQDTDDAMSLSQEDYDFYPSGSVDLKSSDEYVAGGVGESISKTLVGEEKPFLSVLSKADVAVDIPSEERDNIPQLGMRLDEMKLHSCFLEKFYRKVLSWREIYFQVHNENPGLFSDVVFTDDLQSCLEKLKNRLKKCIESRKNLRPMFTLRTDDHVYQSMITERLKQLHIALKKSSSIKYELMKEFEEELEVLTEPYFNKVDRAPDFTQTQQLFEK